MSEPLRNYADAAAWLGVPQKWLEDRVQKGKAPHTRLGKHVRFSQAHLDAIVMAGEPKLITIPPVGVDRTLRPATRGRRRART